MQISFSKIVDLCHEISQDMPIWNGDPKTMISLLTYEKYDVEQLCIGTHSGTHVGTCKHFHMDGSVMDLNVNDLFTSCLVLDFNEIAKGWTLEEDDVKRWQEKYCKVSTKAVILKTDQDRFWNDHTKYFSNYPGFGISATKYLLKNGVRFFGTDAPGVDAWCDEDFLSNREIFKNGGIHMENLTNLDELPIGKPFWIFIGALKMKTGGSPARIVAFV